MLPRLAGGPIGLATSTMRIAIALAGRAGDLLDRSGSVGEPAALPHHSGGDDFDAGPAGTVRERRAAGRVTSGRVARDGRSTTPPPRSRRVTELATLTAWFRTWRERSRQRRALLAIVDDPHLLDDIGLPRDTILRETEKPPWRP